jgi:hypothetical protein
MARPIAVCRSLRSVAACSAHWSYFCAVSRARVARMRASRNHELRVAVSVSVSV